LFHAAVHDRGAMALHALRRQVGDATFFSILRAWYAEHRYGNVSTQDFIALAEHVSGQQLDGLSGSGSTRTAGPPPAVRDQQSGPGGNE
jgi:aminopeptidase N